MKETAMYNSFSLKCYIFLIIFCSLFYISKGIVSTSQPKISFTERTIITSFVLPLNVIIGIAGIAAVLRGIIDLAYFPLIEMQPYTLALKNCFNKEDYEKYLLGIKINSRLRILKGALCCIGSFIAWKFFLKNFVKEA